MPRGRPKGTVKSEAEKKRARARRMAAKDREERSSREGVLDGKSGSESDSGIVEGKGSVESSLVGYKSGDGALDRFVSNKGVCEEYDGSIPLGNPKLERMAVEYMVDLDLQKASQRAGYAYSTFERLRKHECQSDIWKKRVMYLAREFSENCLVSKGWVLEKLVDMWRYNSEEKGDKMRDARVAMSALSKVGEHIDVGAYSRDSGEVAVAIPNINISFGGSGGSEEVRIDEDDMVVIDGK